MQNLELYGLKKDTENHTNGVVKNVDTNHTQLNSKFVYKEGGFGWIVVLATGYCFGVLIGMINNYALILNEIDRVYNETENHVVYSGLYYYYYYYYYYYIVYEQF